MVVRGADREHLPHPRLQAGRREAGGGPARDEHAVREPRVGEQAGQRLALREDVRVGDHDRALATRRDRRDRAHVVGQPGGGVDLRVAEVRRDRTGPLRPGHHVDVAGAERLELVAQTRAQRRPLERQRRRRAVAQRGRRGEQDRREAVGRRAARRRRGGAEFGGQVGRATAGEGMRDPRLRRRVPAPGDAPGGTAPLSTDSTLTASTPQTAVPATTAGAPTSGRVRGLLPPLAVILGVATLLRVGFDQYLNYDARYALLWARDLCNGVTPDYTADFAPTPHPLETWVSVLAAPVRRRGRRDPDLADPAVLRRARLAHVPARRHALPAVGGDRHGARRRHPPRALPRRADRLPGHGLRVRDRRRGAARGASGRGAARRCSACSRSPG